MPLLNHTELNVYAPFPMFWWDLVSQHSAPHPHLPPLTCFPPKISIHFVNLSGSRVGIRSSLQLIPGYPLIVMQLFIALAAPHMHGGEELSICLGAAHDVGQGSVSALLSSS